MAFGTNLYNCECGGLRHICSKHGCLPASREYYHARPATPEYEVVWSGELHRQDATAVQLVPPREEHLDTRIWAMPTFDLDDGEVVDARPRRKYTLTGKHVGKCSRTDPTAPQYLPRTPAPTEEASNG